VPHISRRQRPLPIVSIPHRSGGPSGSALLRAYRSPLRTRRARAPGYRARAGHAVCTGLSVTLPAHHTMMPKRNVLTGHSTREPPRWWAIVPSKLVSCSSYDDVLTFRIMHVVFRHHVVMHFHIIGPTLPLWQCQNDSAIMAAYPSNRALLPTRPISTHHLTRAHADHTLRLTRRMRSTRDVNPSSRKAHNYNHIETSAREHIVR
jgi:hypothetical protein